MGLYVADDGSLSAMSKQHWKDGLRAFDACAANAWPGAKKYQENSQADFVVVQEATRANAECADAKQTARNSGLKTTIGPCATTTADGMSAGLPSMNASTSA